MIVEEHLYPYDAVGYIYWVLPDGIRYFYQYLYVT